MNRAFRVLLYLTVILFSSCEQPTKTVYEEVEVEVPYETVRTETVYVETESEPEVIIETEYVEVETEPEILTETEYIEVTEIVEIVEYVEVESFVEVPVVETVIEYVDNIVYEYREVYIMSETNSNEMAITEYSNYVTTDNKVYGISDGNLVEIERVTGLFKKDSTLYFNMEVTTVETVIDENSNETESSNVSVNAYSQKDGVLTLIDELPEIPESKYVEFEHGDFKIENYDYNGMDTSRVYQGTLVTAYLKVDGACMIGSDLLYSVAETYGNRYKGVYLYAVDGNPRMKFDSGRVW